MTTTTIITTQSFGTGSNLGNFLACTKTALQATTTALSICIQAVLASNGANRTSRLRVWQACSSNSYATALLGCAALRQQATYVDLTLESILGSLTVERSSELLMAQGVSGYHYCWIEAPVLDVAATVTVKLQELP